MYTLTNTSPLIIPFNTILSPIIAPSVTTYCTKLAFMFYLHIYCSTTWVAGVFYQTQHHSAPYFSVCTVHTCRLYRPPVNYVIQPGVFYQTQRGATTCEMRHYIIGLTRLHAHHHHHLHRDTTLSLSKLFIILWVFINYTNEMRHYIIGVTPSHTHHHLHQHLLSTIPILFAN